MTQIDDLSLKLCRYCYSCGRWSVSVELADQRQKRNNMNESTELMIQILFWSAFGYFILGPLLAVLSEYWRTWRIGRQRRKDRNKARRIE